MQDKTLRKFVLFAIIAGFVVISSGMWMWVHSFEHVCCDKDNHKSHCPQPESCKICHGLLFAIKSLDVQISDGLVCSFDGLFYVDEGEVEHFSELWLGVNFSRRGPPAV